MTEIIIEARGLKYCYPGGITGLSGLNLTINRQRKLALLGANGAGKTTILLHLNGTIKPEHGEIYLNGIKATYSRLGLLAWRQQVGIVFQNPEDQLFAGSVYQDISFGPLNLGLTEAEARARVEDALAALEITDLRDRPTHMLSFGQKKRVAIAGAIAMRPTVLIMDEPTAGLDPDGTVQLLQTLDALRTAGTTIVLATHDMDMAYEWADDVAILCDGQIVSVGLPEIVLGDKAILEQSHLRMPFVLETARCIAAAEVQVEHMPRTREGLLAILATYQPSIWTQRPL
ncbi:MAG: energy-coupling factor ABC transporter ATP-binding protein [Armatimonadota bacterium]